MRCFKPVHALVLAIALLTTSCTSLGPRTIPRDQFDYGTAISNAWKEQLLFNVVGLRYVEAPVFVNLSSVINQYSLEGEVALGAGSNTSFTGDDTLTVGGATRYADRPTITYIPITGQKFARSLLTPIPPESLFALIQSGWSPEFVLRLTVKSINGVNNAQAGPGNRRDADPNRFHGSHNGGAPPPPPPLLRAMAPRYTPMMRVSTAMAPMTNPTLGGFLPEITWAILSRRAPGNTVTPLTSFFSSEASGAVRLPSTSRMWMPDGQLIRTT